jgi:hypothetical protein
MYLLVIALVVVVVIIVATSPDYSVLEWVVFSIFLLVILIVGFNYYFGVDIAAKLKDWQNPKLDITVVSKNPLRSEEVFHVPGAYNYSDAKALCRAYGGKLANIDQMTKAYNRGAEWCNYGWSDDNMVLFPTQKKTWSAFNETENNKQDCGRPGINGGYNNDLKQKLGANCFGVKPEQTQDIKKPFIPPKPPVVVPTNAADAQADYFKKNLPSTVAPFNYSKWNA